MQGDICDHPEQNERPNSWNSKDLKYYVIITKPDPSLTPKTLSNDCGALDLPDTSNLSISVSKLN